MPDMVTNKDLERKLVTCEMKCLRKAVNKTRRDKIRNEAIRDMVGAKPVYSTSNNNRSSGSDTSHVCS